MTFILVQHLDPTHESMMLDLLAGHTSSMLVLQAIDGMPAFAAPEDRIMIARVPRVESKTLVTRAGRTTERVLATLTLHARHLSCRARNRSHGWRRIQLTRAPLPQNGQSQA